MVIGGRSVHSVTDDVELISLDPRNYPIPFRLQNLKRFSKKVWWGGGALFSPGNITIKFTYILFNFLSPSIWPFPVYNNQGVPKVLNLLQVYWHLRR